MKLNQLLRIVIFILLLSLKAFGQNVDKSIPIDFMALENEYKEELEYGKTFQINVSNINRYLYKVDGVKVETNFNIAVPSALTGVKLPAYFFTEEPSPGKMRTPSRAAKSATNVYKDIQKQLLKVKETVEISAADINKALILLNELNRLTKDCSDKHDDILKQALQKSSFFLTGSTNYTDSASQIASKLKDKLEGITKSPDQELSKLKALVDEYEVLGNQEIDEQRQFNIDQKRIVENQKDTKSMSRSELKKSDDAIRSFEKKITAYMTDKKDFSELMEKIWANEEKAKTAVQEIKKFELDDNSFKIVHLFQLVSDPSLFTYKSEIFTAKTDEIKYTITIEPTEFNTCDLNGKRIISVIVNVKGGWKIDFSTGAFVNLGNDEFMGNSYYYVYEDSDHRKIVTADRGSRALMSVGALMHFYWRSTSYVNAGLSMGVSTTAAVSDLLFHAGPSAFIGKKNRLVISAGATLKSSTVLDQKLQTGIIYTKIESPDAIPTVSVFPKLGYFFSITYNFTANK